MAEYIDREDLIYTLHNLCKINCTHYPSERDIYCGMCETGEIIGIIKDIPSADVKPVVHGHWKSEDKMFGNIPFKCSNCGYLTRETTDGSVLGKPKFNFCPNCGARMDGNE